LKARVRRSLVRLSVRYGGSGNVKKATALRGVRLPGEEKALKRRIPWAPLARNRARRARGGVQGAVTVKNRACRLPGGGNSGLTGLPEPHASKGLKPHERCCNTASITVVGDAATRVGHASKGRQGHGRMVPIRACASWEPGPHVEHLAVHPLLAGKGMEGALTNTALHSGS
jgi:hypothetical protein